MIGRRLAQYKVLDELGRGGMGVVYRALDTSLGREVALKVLGPVPGTDIEGERRLRQEARAAAALTHPAVSVVYEIDEADGATFIAMELVKGQALAARLAEAAWHHPDIDIRWNKVKLVLTTHDEGGLTRKDFKLAREFDAL